ncbi:MAG: hypothetical protein H7144_02190 [Burkholderiales bacterium]|nr:hypothetical protein [Phycisphaerae bacterium]
MLWDFPHIVATLASAIEQDETALRLEQAVYGLDSLAELKLHEHAARALAACFAVAREVHYPSSSGNKLTHRQRCDLVLSPLGRPLRLDRAPPTLFDAPEQTEPGDALWLEVKIAYQFREGGVRHGGYSAQWRGAVVADLLKMEADPLIRHAGLLLIVFTESIEVFEKDVELFEDVLVTKGVIAGFRQTRSIPVLDRMGHRFCSLAVWPTIQR